MGCYELGFIEKIAQLTPLTRDVLGNSARFLAKSDVLSRIKTPGGFVSAASRARGNLLIPKGLDLAGQFRFLKRTYPGKELRLRSVLERLYNRLGYMNTLSDTPMGSGDMKDLFRMIMDTKQRISKAQSVFRRSEGLPFRIDMPLRGMPSW